MAKLKSKSARDVLIDLSMTPRDTKPKRRKSSPLRARVCDLDIKGAEKVIERFSTLKRNVDLATVGALQSTRSVFSGSKRRATKAKAKASAPPVARKKTGKKASKKTRRKGA